MENNKKEENEYKIKENFNKKGKDVRIVLREVFKDYFINALKNFEK